MKKIFLGLLVAGAALAGSAFINVNKQVFTYKYSPRDARSFGGIYVENVTGQIQEIDYQCLASSGVCTFQSNVPITGTDVNGTYINPTPTQFSAMPGSYIPISDRE